MPNKEKSFGMRFATQKKSKKNICTPVDRLKKICSNVDMTNRKQFLKGNEMRIESHENLYTEILSHSDCCGEQMTGEQVDYGICPCCGEHCEAIFQEWILEKI